MDATSPLPVEEAIIELGNSNQPLLNARLAELSNLTSEELELFKRSWTGIEPERRRQIVHRLVELAEDNLELNFDSIFKHCLKDLDDEVRSQAIEGLWENEEASLINPLINLLEQDSSEKVQTAAATALGKFAILAEDRKLPSDYIPRIEAALLAVINNQDKPLGIRRRALEAIVPFNLPQVKTAIMDAYQSHHQGLKISAIYAMGKHGDPSWLTILLKELASPEAELRYEAAGACGELGEEAAVPHLARLVTDSDIDVRIAAIQALGKIGGGEAKEYLESCLSNSTQAVSQAAEQALLELEAMENPLSFRI